MAATRADFERRLSGGGANTDPNLSLGGAISSELILTQSNAFVGGGISGVTLVDAAGHDASNFGDGSLQFSLAGDLLLWTPFGGSLGAPIGVGVDGRYIIPAATTSKYLVVDVVAASLPGANTSDSVTIGALPNELFDDVSGEEAALGDTNYRCFYVTNVHATDDIFNIRMFIENQPVGADSLEVGLDPAGINGTPAVIANESTAPGGVSFSTPTDLGTALLVGNLTPTDFFPIWVKRIVPVSTITGEPDDLSRIQFAVSFA